MQVSYYLMALRARELYSPFIRSKNQRELGESAWEMAGPADHMSGFILWSLPEPGPSLIYLC